MDEKAKRTFRRRVLDLQLRMAKSVTERGTALPVASTGGGSRRPSDLPPLGHQARIPVLVVKYRVEKIDAVRVVLRRPRRRIFQLVGAMLVPRQRLLRQVVAVLQDGRHGLAQDAGAAGRGKV